VLQLSIDHGGSNIIHNLQIAKVLGNSKESFSNLPEIVRRSITFPESLINATFVVIGVIYSKL
jgi:hypothetical protein